MRGPGGARPATVPNARRRAGEWWASRQPQRLASWWTLSRGIEWRREVAELIRTARSLMRQPGRESRGGTAVELLVTLMVLNVLALVLTC